MRSLERPEQGTLNSRSSLLLVLLFAFSIVWLAVWFAHAQGYCDERAFVDLGFARSLSQGQGFRFSGQLAYGTTSPLWVWLLVVAHAAVPDWIFAAKLLSVLATVALLGGVYHFARHLTVDAESGESCVFAAAMVCLVAVNPFVDQWAFSGVADVAAAALACCGLALASGPLAKPIAPSRLLAACMCAGLAPLLRTDMLVLSVLVGAVLFVRWVNLPASAGRKVGVFFSGLALVGVPFLGWSVYALHAFGTVVPNGVAASVAASSESVIVKLVGSYALGFPVVLVGLIALALWWAARLRDASRGREVPRAAELYGAARVALVWPVVTGVLLALHHTHVETRYVLVSGPALTVALFALAWKRWPRVYTVGLWTAGLLAIVTSIGMAWPLITAESKVTGEYAALAGVVRGLPPGEAVATEHAAEIAFLSQGQVVDMSGLMRPGVLPFVFDPTDDRRVWWAHAQGARYMVLDHSPEPNSTMLWSRDLPVTNWSVKPAHKRAFDKLILWKLPPSPTLPVPADMPVERGP